MNDALRREVLEIARDAVAAAVRMEKPHVTEPRASELLEHRGAFVTIKNHGMLRGCIGQFVADRPLFEIIQEMALAAATRDSRFADEPIRHDELPDLDIDVTILGPLEKITNPLDFKLGKDGIYIRKGWAGGCFLPQVAVETGWSKEEFLSQCARGKAGLQPDAWKDPGTDVYRFSCEVAREE